MAYSIESLIRKTEEAETAARAANIARQQRIETILDEIIGRFRTGGAYGAGMESQIARGKVRDVAAGKQQLVSSGLYGTTLAAGLPKKWEEEVGMPARGKLEDIRMEKLSEAQRGKAGFLERISEPYPDYGPMMQAVSSIGQASAMGEAPVVEYGGGDSAGKISGMEGFESIGGYGRTTPVEAPATRAGGTGGVYGGQIGEPIAPGGPRMDIDFGAEKPPAQAAGKPAAGYLQWSASKQISYLQAKLKLAPANVSKWEKEHLAKLQSEQKATSSIPSNYGRWY